MNYNYGSYSSPYGSAPANPTMNSTASPTANPTDYSRQTNSLHDYGPVPMVVNIEQATIQNTNFRTVLWTGEHLQLTLMSLNPGEDIGAEIHPQLDQFLRIEQGQGMVMMGNSKENLNFRQSVWNNYAIVIPAGTWHNLINTGSIPLKLYSLYAPPQHPYGTIHVTRQEAEEHHD